jgi:hypothetical protein
MLNFVMQGTILVKDVQYNDQKKCIRFLKNKKKSATDAILILAEINIILARFNISLNFFKNYTN